jgi:putative hydrolase of the HAD superfamily
MMIRAVVFDAVGTVMYPSPPVAEIYRMALARHCDVQLTPDEIDHVFRQALNHRNNDPSLRTDENTEREFWRQLIHGLCGDHLAFEGCFADLHAQFGEPSNWACFEDVAACLSSLQAQGLTIAIASNFDLRLHSVLNGLEPLAGVKQRFVSSEIGFRKPAEKFFQVVCRRLQLEPGQVLFVGDDLQNDVFGAIHAGCRSAWIVRQPNRPEEVPAETTWLPDLLQTSELVRSLWESST